MKKLLSFMTVAALLIIAAPEAYGTNSDGTVDVEGYISADPCKRNQTEPCPAILLFPKSKTEVYVLGGEKVETIDLESADALEMQKGPGFALKLKPESYLFYIENKLNGQKSIFGPVEITEEMNRLRLDFTMYNSFVGTNGVVGDREICLKSGREMNCNAVTQEGLVIKPNPHEIVPQVPAQVSQK